MNNKDKGNSPEFIYPPSPDLFNDLSACSSSTWAAPFPVAPPENSAVVIPSELRTEIDSLLEDLESLDDPIEKLTPQQESLLSEYQTKWRAIAFSSAPEGEVNSDAVAEAICRIYKLLGLPVPEDIIWVDSPLAILKADAEFQLNQRGDNTLIYEELLIPWFRRIEYGARLSIDDLLYAHIESCLTSNMGSEIQVPLIEALFLAEHFLGIESKIFRQSIRNAARGSGDACWLATIDYCAEVLGIQNCKKISPFNILAQHCGWWIPREKTCLVSRKPVACNINEQHLLCNRSVDAALQFQDGFAVNAINGLAIGELGESISFKAIQHSDLLGLAARSHLGTAWRN